jgi:hypothetical protein
MKRLLFLISILWISVTAHGQNLDIWGVSHLPNTPRVGDTVTITVLVINQSTTTAWNPAPIPTGNGVARLAIGLPVGVLVVRPGLLAIEGPDASYYNSLQILDSSNFRVQLAQPIAPQSSTQIQFRVIAKGVGTGNILPQLIFPTGEGSEGGGTNSVQHPITVQQPLPVTFLTFNAYRKEATAVLDWITATEQHNKGFDIERSHDGNSWSKIGFTATKAVNGNSSEKLDYTFIDEQPLTGINFYRLKQTDLDGKYTYSEVRQVVFDKAGNISLYPNPAKEYVTITGLKGSETIFLYSVTGQLLGTHQANARGIYGLPLHGLAKGIYYVKVSSKDVYRNFKLIIE